MGAPRSIPKWYIVSLRSGDVPKCAQLISFRNFVIRVHLVASRNGVPGSTFIGGRRAGSCLNSKARQELLFVSANTQRQTPGGFGIQGARMLFMLMCYLEAGTFRGKIHAILDTSTPDQSPSDFSSVWCVFENTSISE